MPNQSGPAGFFGQLAHSLSRRPLLVLSVCGVLIVIEALVISHFASRGPSDPLELQYYNPARYTTRDLDQRSVEMIPTDSIASGIHNPVDDAFYVEPDRSEKVSTTSDRALKSKAAEGVDVDKLTRITNPAEAPPPSVKKSGN